MSSVNATQLKQGLKDEQVRMYLHQMEEQVITLHRIVRFPDSPLDMV
jgi:rRNA pseudouridine-1189 N-methylase Emg1 (Nep1/Mra1 family)